MKKIACILLFISTSLQFATAQTKADIFNLKIPITWLGVDYSQTKFLGLAEMFNKGGQMTSVQFRDIYTLAWNQLFITEPKKFDVAKALHRDSVKYAMDVAESSNSTTTNPFFTQDPNDFKKLTETTLAGVVKNYDFKGHTGIGFIFFVEGMSKGQAEAGVWVTFVDMGSKTILLTKYEKAASGGFGFRNYWAKPLYLILKQINDDYKSWSK